MFQFYDPFKEVIEDNMEYLHFLVHLQIERQRDGESIRWRVRFTGVIRKEAISR